MGVVGQGRGGVSRVRIEVQIDAPPTCPAVHDGVYIRSGFGTPAPKAFTIYSWDGRVGLLGF